MSADDIVFDEVQYREPVRARRPDRDQTLACLAYQVPQVGDLPIFLDRKSADAIERHALRDTSVELGGVLLGRECLDEQTGEPFVWVTESLEAKHYENTQASFTYTHDSWEELTRERDKLHPTLDIVGWYHTHPDFGIFLSGHDLFLHRNFFPQPLQVAYVIDPIRQTRGFFRWRADGLEQVGGFYLTADRADRVALARQVNDLESIASTEAVSSGLSPRLEAELIAMLSRPQTVHSSVAPADRALQAVVFGSLGLLVGGLVVAAGGWLANVANQVQHQSATLAEMRDQLSKSQEASQATIATLLARSGSTADPKKFVEDLTRTRSELAESNEAVKTQQALAATAAAEYRRIYAELDKSRSSEHEAKEIVKDLEAENKQKTDRLDDLEAEQKQWLATDAGSAARKYGYAFYAAIAGWALALAATTAWVLTLFRDGDELDQPARSPRPIPPTGSIS